MEVNRLARETGAYVLDGVLSVIDVENWAGYEDTSLTAKMQARYTDLVVLNKWEACGERRLEDVEDKILALDVEPQIPRTKSAKGWVSTKIVFGLDARLAGQLEEELGTGDEGHDHAHTSEVEVLSVVLQGKGGSVDTEKLARLLEDPTKDEIYRIKGILYASTPPKSSDTAVPTTTAASSSIGRTRYILNWAFGRWTFTPVPLAVDDEQKEEEPPLRLTVVTAKYESTKWKKQIEQSGLIALTDAVESVLKVGKIS